MVTGRAHKYPQAADTPPFRCGNFEVPCLSTLVSQDVVYEQAAGISLARDYGGDSVQVVIGDGLESFELHVAPL